MQRIRITTFAFILIFAVVASATVSAALQGKKGIERSATSTITTRLDKEHGIVADITNRRFTFNEFFVDNVSSDENRRTLLLLEEFKSEKSFSAEGQLGTVRVQAWLGTDPSPTKKIWTFTQDGDEGVAMERFYKVIKHGCCGAEDTSVYYNLSAGQKVFTSSAPDLFKIEVPNTSNSLTRYVGYSSAMASIAPPESSEPRVVIGAIEYGSEDKVIDRVLVRRTVKGDADFGTPPIEALYRRKRVKNEALELWGANNKNDPSSLSSFDMVFSFETAGSITIPVVNDRFDLAHAISSKGFAIVRPK
ncbi:MAG: hypothetical protein ACREDR_01945 [Blastocatellia bacterium]